MSPARKILIALALTLSASPSHAQQAQAPTGPGSHEKLRQETIFAVKGRVNPLLGQYCRDACSIIDVKVDIEEAVAETDDLGFEAVVGEDLNATLFVDKITLEIQVDDRVTSVNRDRLLQILRNNLQNVGSTVDIVWRPVTVPQIGQGAAMEEQLKRQLALKLSQAIEKVIDAYCPDDCVLSAVAVDGKLVTPDEAQGAAPEEIVRDKSGNAILKIENIDIEVAMDSGLRGDIRKKITNIMKARTRFASPINLDVQVTAFPESYAKQKEKEQKSSEDPFGLSKLRETLTIFKELAGTKEIFTTTTSRDSSATQRENTSESSQKNENALSTSSQQAGEVDVWKWAAVIGALLLLGGFMLMLVLRFSQANRDAKLMMQALEPAAGFGRQGASAGSGTPVAVDASGHPIKVEVNGAVAGAGGIAAEARREMTQRLKIVELKDELIRVFLDQPKVAKETFSRLLQEEGIESTAKYVHIFGHLVIFELLGDPNLQRDLYELSEFYHKTEFDFRVEEEHKLLTQLKTRVTANEIRVLTRKQTDKFDFLLKLDSSQIYNLLVEEKPQVQSIVLTQLDHKRRRAVFDMYQGPAKVDLMRELCRADAIPKEYLSNVAKALEKKVMTRPEFDTENLRSNDILLELMEKAELVEQRDLMRNLLETNPEAARGIKLKLVTVEVMPYLKDGHLLELVLGMDREDLLSFLSGTREHIRALLLAKAPEELAESWLEDLANIKGFNEQNFRLVELKVINRIRALVNNGVINLLDINDMIFGKAEDLAGEEDADVVGVESESSMVA
jgi:flagellar motor switch protein FliG